MTDKLVSVHEFDEPKLEALVETMFLAAYADGEFSDDERKHFVKSIESLTDAHLSGEGLSALIARVEGAGGDRTERLASVKARLGSVEACKVALSLAIRLMNADGIIRTSERELILEMADALGVDPSEVADMVKTETR
jgi:tellurite resistance protein